MQIQTAQFTTMARKQLTTMARNGGHQAVGRTAHVFLIIQCTM